VRKYAIAPIPGDGIGPEVNTAGVEVPLACADHDARFTLDITHFDWSSERYKKIGSMMPSDGIETLKKFDAILFGAVGAVDIRDHVTLWGLRLAMCQSLDHYANVRPVRILNRYSEPAARSPSGRYRLGDYSGKFGGRVFRSRRALAPGIHGGSRDGGSRLHACWRAAHYAICV
jgi:tartrate dehydrogenase/decarboxylase / D-malate dehydrogenase